MISNRISQVLTKNKEILEWSHIFLILLLIFGVPYIGHYLQKDFTLFSHPIECIGTFILILVGHCQNIGVMHHFAHRLPPGPTLFARWVAKLIHSLGGLKYEQAKTAHSFHHKYLGTSLDPDRLGYLTTTTPLKRFQYLFLIGPLRARFAPVDISSVLRAMPADQLRTYYKSLRQDRILFIGLHLGLALMLGSYFLIYWAALIGANILSNAREMTEHGNQGQAAYVNIQPSFFGLIFFSTPGFWYHGVHHMHPTVHYLSLPAAAQHQRLKILHNLPFLERKSYLRYLIFGT